MVMCSRYGWFVKLSMGRLKLFTEFCFGPAQRYSHRSDRHAQGVADRCVALPLQVKQSHNISLFFRQLREQCLYALPGFGPQHPPGWVRSLTGQCLNCFKV